MGAHSHHSAPRSLLLSSAAAVLVGSQPRRRAVLHGCVRAAWPLRSLASCALRFHPSRCRSGCSSAVAVLLSAAVCLSLVRRCGLFVSPVVTCMLVLRGCPQHGRTDISAGSAELGQGQGWRSARPRISLCRQAHGSATMDGGTTRRRRRRRSGRAYAEATTISASAGRVNSQQPDRIRGHRGKDWTYHNLAPRMHAKEIPHPPGPRSCSECGNQGETVPRLRFRSHRVSTQLVSTRKQPAQHDPQATPTSIDAS